MLLDVVHDDGTRETISFSLPAVCFAGKKMNYISSQEITHWFNSNGTYDGWSKNTDGMSEEEVNKMIEKIEENRNIHKEEEDEGF